MNPRNSGSIGNNMESKVRRPRTISIGLMMMLMSLAFFAFTIIVVVIITFVVKRQAVNELAREDARQTSRLIFQSLYSAMRKGWDKHEIKDIITRLNNEEPDMSIAVYRGEPVARQFGVREDEGQAPMDDPVFNSMKDGEERIITMHDNIRYIYPLIVKKECQQCHTKAEIGEVNGVIDIKHPIKNLKVSMDYILNIVILYFLVMLIVLLVAQYVNIENFVVRPVTKFAGVIKDILDRSDLTMRVDRPSRIKELYHLSEHFNQLISSLYDYQEKLKDLSSKDPLTGILNRRKFEEMLHNEIKRSSRHGHSFTILLIDLDNFKYINDTYGHPVGDLALKEVTLIIQDLIRRSDSLGRIGGDEFAIILPETNMESGMEAARKIKAAFDVDELQLPVGNLKVQFSIGLVNYPDNGVESNKLMSSADIAMYKAKKEGKNRVATIDESDKETFMEIVSLRHWIEKSLDEDRLVPYYHGIVDTKTRKTYAYEVLARIVNEDGSISVANDFIKVAEELGFAEEIDRRILEKGLKCKREELNNSDIKLFFNLSSRSFNNPEHLLTFPDIIRGAGCRTEDIVFEITEREALPNISSLAPIINDLNKEGISFALDDFGSGFSSFLYLKYLPVQYAKIEGSFIYHMLEDDQDHILVKHINQMAKEFGLKTVAEYVESEAILKKLNELNIDLSQGYLFGMPGTCKDLPEV